MENVAGLLRHQVVQGRKDDCSTGDRHRCKVGHCMCKQNDEVHWACIKRITHKLREKGWYWAYR